MTTFIFTKELINKKKELLAKKIKENEKMEKLKKFSKKFNVPIEFLKEEEIEFNYLECYEYRWCLIDTRTNTILDIA